MVIKEVLDRLEIALYSLTPELIEFVDYEVDDRKPMIMVRIVSPGFAHMKTLTRCRVLDDTLSQKDPELYSRFCFACQAYTPLEYLNLRFKKEELH